MSTHTFYDGTIAIAQSLLRSLTHVLQKTEQQRPNATNALLNARLIEDMLPLADQIRIATQFSEALAARLTAREPVKLEAPTTFAQAYEYIGSVLKTLAEADKEVVNSQADVQTATQLGPEIKVDMSGAVYAHTVVLPNVYFHVSTAYGILRKEGVTLGKRDFVAGYFPMKE